MKIKNLIPLIGQVVAVANPQSTKAKTGYAPSGILRAVDATNRTATVTLLADSSSDSPAGDVTYPVTYILGERAVYDASPTRQAAKQAFDAARAERAAQKAAKVTERRAKPQRAQKPRGKKRLDGLSPVIAFVREALATKVQLTRALGVPRPDTAADNFVGVLSAARPRVVMTIEVTDAFLALLTAEPEVVERLKRACKALPAGLVNEYHSQRAIAQAAVATVPAAPVVAPAPAPVATPAPAVVATVVESSEPIVQAIDATAMALDAGFADQPAPEAFPF